MDITAASGHPDSNGNKISIQNLATASGFDLNIKTPGQDELIVSPNQGYSLTPGAGAMISFGSLPTCHAGGVL